MMLALFLLLPLCLCDQIRIVSNQQLNQDAFKARIRSLTLKSTIERTFNHSMAKHSSTNFVVQKTPEFQAKTTIDTYLDAPPPTMEPNPVLSPSGISGCFCIVPCAECCKNTSSDATTITPRRRTIRTSTSTPALTDQPTDNPKTPSPVQTTPSVPIPTGSSGCNNTVPGCCVIPIMIPCYSCPCLSQCSIVPISDCPCGVDWSTTYQCPNIIPNQVPVNELTEWINEGFRILDTLKPVPNCANSPGMAPYPPQYPWPNSGSYIPQPPFAGAINYKVVENENQQQPNQFMPLNAGGMEEMSQIHPSNYYLNRQHRQRSFPAQQSDYYHGGQYNYPHIPYPNPPLIPQIAPWPYPQPGAYPMPELISSTESTSTESMSTTTAKSSGAHSSAFPASVLLGLFSLLFALCLIH